MVDRVLGDTAGQRPLAQPARPPGLAEVRILVVGVRHRTDRRHALAVDVALLARVQANDDHAAITTDHLHVGAGRAGDLATLHRLHLHVVDDGADRHRGELHGIARLHVGALGRDHLVADAQALRRDDIGLLAVGVADQRDERGTVGVVLQPFDRALGIPLATLEVDEAVLLLVTACDAAAGHVTFVVAAAGLALALGQRLDGLALVQLRFVDQHQPALGRGRRIILLECHVSPGPPSSRRWTGRPSASRSPSSCPNACREHPSSAWSCPSGRSCSRRSR